jgi:hypothetical protein
MSKSDLDSRTPEYIEPFDQSFQYLDDYNVKVACSLNHFDTVMQQTLENMKPVQICRLGGAGNKINRIVLGEVDSYV